jgi:predicted  nucleic acid-binding Zn-ribbon protein
MPHQCTECGHVFPDGSKEMLSGCPDCGGNKFQFRPTSDPRDSDTGRGSSTEPGTPAESGGSSEPGTSSEDERGTPSSDSPAGDPDPATADSERSVGDPASTSTPPAEPSEPSGSPTPSETGASTDVDSTAEPRPNNGDAHSPPETKEGGERSSGRTDPTDRTGTAASPNGPAASTGTEDTDDVEALRRELNDQFESIKILEPGQYELNLMELYNREERIIALKEDGQYVIDVPDTWLGDDDP